jgi:hypothetical protein
MLPKGSEKLSNFAVEEPHFQAIFDTIGLVELRIWYSLQNFYDMPQSIFNIVCTIVC